MAMPRITIGTVVRIVIICFLVGLFLAFFDIDPRTAWIHLAAWAQDSVRWLFDNLGKAFSYVLLGAAIVLPIWLVLFVLRMFRNRP